MAYLVRWQLIGRSRRRLDSGGLGESFCTYGDAVAAISEFLRPYPEVSRCAEESYWLARRSSDADLAIWIWVERPDAEAGDETDERADLRLGDGTHFKACVPSP
jgi:hypothetical protein